MKLLRAIDKKKIIFGHRDVVDIWPPVARWKQCSCSCPPVRPSVSPCFHFNPPPLSRHSHLTKNVCCQRERKTGRVREIQQLWPKGRKERFATRGRTRQGGRVTSLGPNSLPILACRDFYPNSINFIGPHNSGRRQTAASGFHIVLYATSLFSTSF